MLHSLTKWLELIWELPIYEFFEVNLQNFENGGHYRNAASIVSGVRLPK